tara:strand:+ start:1410 stop:2030 length:621 start_codon:yes stop_codon:yes gene_type:complete
MAQHFVLYVGRDKKDRDMYCPGSLVCLALVDKIEPAIPVQDCSILLQTQVLPPWLNGTPILMDKTDPVPARGTDAVRVLQAHLKQQMQSAVSRAPSPLPPPPPKPRTAGLSSRMTPTNTRQPATKPRDEPQGALEVQRGGGDMSTGADVFFENADLEVDMMPSDTMQNGQSSNAPLKDSKITEDDLQQFMEARKNSPAAAAPQQTA